MRKLVATALLTGLLTTGSAHAQSAQGQYSPAVPVEQYVDATIIMSPAPAPDRFWASADYMLGWLRGNRLPALVTTSVAGTAQANAGELGDPATTVLFGNQTVNDDLRSGGRLALGFWIDPDYKLGIEVGGFFLAPESASFQAFSDDGTILARPFFEAATGAPNAALLAFPGFTTNGFVSVDVRSEEFYSGHVHLRERFYNGPNLRLESLFGYRTLHYRDEIQIQQSLTALAAPFVPGTRLDAFDRFDSRNEFHGCEFGMTADITSGRLSVQLLGKAALGNVRRVTTIDGGTITSVPGAAPTASQGGLLALSSNIGTHESDDWTVAPEAGVTFRWAFSDSLRVRAGYTFLVWPQVSRAGDQIDLNVNSNLIPPITAGGAGPQQPAPILNRTDIWVHSLNFGLELNY